VGDDRHPHPAGRVHPGLGRHHPRRGRGPRPHLRGAPPGPHRHRVNREPRPLRRPSRAAGGSGGEDRRPVAATARVASPRLALVAYLAISAVAVVVIRSRNRAQYFFQDEWVVLADRTLAPSSLIRPHWGHCIVLPTIAYRL